MYEDDEEYLQQEGPQEPDDDLSQEEPTNLSQFALLSYLTSSQDVWVLAQPLLKPEYFDAEYSSIIEFCQTYTGKYNRLPSKLMIRGETGVRLETPEDAQEEHVRTWLASEVEAHCRHKALCAALINGSMRVQEDDSRSVAAEQEAEMRRVLNMSVTRHIGVEVHTGMKDALTRAKENSGIPCGIKHLDLVLDGGFNFRSLNMFVVASGGGKSVILSNIAYNYARDLKYNVVYISLELDEDMIQKRFASIMTGTYISQIYQNMDNIDKELRLRMVGENKKEGHVFIKKMPANSTTTADIRAYIYYLEMQTGLKIQVCCTDYLDLLAPTQTGIKADNIHLRDKYVTEEHRNMMDDLGLIGFTASQRIKGSEDESNGDSQGHVAGGTGKVNTVDNLIFGRRSDRDRQEGKMLLTVKKARTSSADGKRFPILFDNNTLILSAVTDQEFEEALPYLTTKDFVKQSPVQEKYKHLRDAKKSVINNRAPNAQVSDKLEKLRSQFPGRV